MDSRLKITDKRRTVTQGISLTTPLITHAWRFMQAEYLQRIEEKRREEKHSAIQLEELANIAEEVYRLQKAVKQLESNHAASNNQNLILHIAAISVALLNALARIGIQILVPEGELYNFYLQELFHNIAQQFRSDVLLPTIIEVVTPAIVRETSVLRMGKAVVALPLKFENTDNEKV